MHLARHIRVVSPRPHPPARLPNHSAPAPPCACVQLRDQDPVLRAAVGATLRDKLQACAQLHGQAFQDVMAGLDQHLTQQVKAAMGMGT